MACGGQHPCCIPLCLYACLFLSALRYTADSSRSDAYAFCEGGLLFVACRSWRFASPCLERNICSWPKQQPRLRSKGPPQPTTIQQTTPRPPCKSSSGAVNGSGLPPPLPCWSLQHHPPGRASPAEWREEKQEAFALD